MKKLLIGTLSLLTIGFGIHIERINPDTSDLVTISEAEARRGGGGRRGGRGGRRMRRGGGRRSHRSVHVNRRGGRGGAFVAGAIVGASILAVGSRHTHLPIGCTSYDYYGRPYYHCGGVYYQPVYEGPEVVYVVVDKP